MPALPPCACPSQGKRPRTVQTIVHSRRFKRSIATEGRFLGPKMKTTGRGRPCACPPPLWAPFSGQKAENCANHSAHRRFKRSIATEGRFLGRKMKTTGRGRPCACPPPLWAPFSGQKAENCANHSAQSQIQKVYRPEGRPLGPKMKTTGRGAPCGCPPPLWAPFSGQKAKNCANHSAQSQIQKVYSD